MPAQFAEAQRIVRRFLYLRERWPTPAELLLEMLFPGDGNVEETGRSDFYTAHRITQRRYCRDAIDAVRAEVARSSAASKHPS